MQSCIGEQTFSCLCKSRLLRISSLTRGMELREREIRLLILQNIINLHATASRNIHKDWLKLFSVLQAHSIGASSS